MGDVVTNGMIGIFHYTISKVSTSESAGESSAEALVIETTEGREPIPYLHGEGTILPGLEAALEGKRVGDTIDVVLTPDQAYGEHNGMDPIAVPKREIPKGVPLVPGELFWAEGSKGQSKPLWIERVVGSKVYVQTNHPLAGESLRVQAQVVGVRTPTGEEREHGHPHGLDGLGGHR